MLQWLSCPPLIISNLIKSIWFHPMLQWLSCPPLIISNLIRSILVLSNAVMDIVPTFDIHKLNEKLLFQSNAHLWYFFLGSVIHDCNNIACLILHVRMWVFCTMNRNFCMDLHGDNKTHQLCKNSAPAVSKHLQNLAERKHEVIFYKSVDDKCKMLELR